ncbi:MAG: preprotein translocase subunit SecG [Phototrophicales bacterium]|nr:MAG: preprotein translocase subunit SecG [Phototrophicales bacterium]
MLPSLETALQVIQIIISLTLIALVLFQASSSGGIGSLFGGGGGGVVQRTRRGLEKTLFQLTIAVSILFVINAIVQLLIQ